MSPADVRKLKKQFQELRLDEKNTTQNEISINSNKSNINKSHRTCFISVVYAKKQNFNDCSLNEMRI